MKIIAIIQARIHSERLPDKVLMNLPNSAGKPLLEWITSAIKKSKLIDECFVATSITEGNEKIVRFCEEQNIKYYRGSENNVLSRFAYIAQKEQADVVVRLTGDNPILDISILEDAIKEHIDKGTDFTQTKGLPIGMNFEIMSGKALLSMKEDLTVEEKEHVTYYFKRRKDVNSHIIDKFGDPDLSNIRVTVDYPEDFLLVSFILSNLENDEYPSFPLIKKLFQEKPWIFGINKDKTQVEVYEDFEEEKREAAKFLERAGFIKSARLFEKF